MRALLSVHLEANSVRTTHTAHQASKKCPLLHPHLSSSRLRRPLFLQLRIKEIAASNGRDVVAVPPEKAGGQPETLDPSVQ